LVVARGGPILGDITAGQQAEVFAFGSLLGKIESGAIATVTTLDSQVGDVSAGSDAWLMVGDTASGAISASQDVALFGYGQVTANIAAGRDAMVHTWGDAANSLAAGQDIFLFTGGNATSDVTANRIANVQSFGSVSGAIQAGHDLQLWTAGPSSGTATAGQDAMLTSLGTSAMTVTAGRDALLFTFDDHHGDVDAGQDAFVSSSAGATTHITAGRDAGLYALDYALGSLHAGQNANLFTWGTAAGPMLVIGENAAQAWTFGDFNGSVHSASGEALLTTFGTAASSSVSGATEAFAFVVGDFLGSIYGGHNATAITLGEFHGTLDATAEDGFLLSLGTIDADASSGRNLMIFAEGDLRGHFTAGQDAAAATYGDFAADFSAAQDIASIWARGAISGRIEAGRDLGKGSATDDGDGESVGDTPYSSIFSYGGIDAELTAGRDIGVVQSSGSIAGLFEAAGAIERVESGAAVTATLIASPAPTPVAFSTALRDMIAPAVPPSPASEVRAAMEAVHALALDQRAEMADAIADMLIQHADAKQNAQDDLANSRTALSASNTAILAEEWLALAADIAFANADFDQVRQQLQASFSNIDEAAAVDSAALQRQIDQIAGQRAAAFAAAQQTRTGSVQELIVADAATTAALAAARKASQEEKASRDEIWETAKRMPPPPPPPPRIFANPPASIGRVLGDLLRDDAAQRATHQHYDNTEQRIAIGQDALEMFLDFTLFGTVKNLYGAITGHDIIRDREMTSEERTRCGFFAGLAVAGTLFYFLDDIAETVGHYAKRLKGASEPLDDAAAPAVQLARGATNRAVAQTLVPFSVHEFRVCHGAVVRPPAVDWCEALAAFRQGSTAISRRPFRQAR
jgi:hypothetical protein